MQLPPSDSPPNFPPDFIPEPFPGLRSAGELERNVAVIAWAISCCGISPGNEGSALELRQRIHRTIDLCDEVASRSASLRDEVGYFISKWNNNTLREQARTIDGILKIEEEAYRRSKGKAGQTIGDPEVPLVVHARRSGMTATVRVNTEAAIKAVDELVKSLPNLIKVEVV